MLSFTVLVSLALLAAPAFGAPVKIQIAAASGDKLEDSYIVKLKDGVNKKLTLAWLESHLGANSTISYDYDASYFNAFSGLFSAQTLNALQSNKDVEYIAEDAIFTTQTITRSDAPWGLERVSGPKQLTSTDPGQLIYSHTYDESAGEGVDIYILDTGVSITHRAFGPRASWGYSVFPGSTTDGHGHGTHCAGTAAGDRYGVAPKANIIAVKVLSDGGSGSASGIVAGIDWVIGQARTTGRPSVISMSLGGGIDLALDNGVTSAVTNGVHVVVAAGNSNTDAANTSPARAPNVITVGATTIDDTRAGFSSYGAVIDVWAPGQNVISAWIGSDTATASLSGTSMACPHVAGVAAYLLGIYGPQTPEALTARLKGLAVSGKITGIPAGTTTALVQIA